MNDLKERIEFLQRLRMDRLQDAANLVRDPDRWGPIQTNVATGAESAWTGAPQEMRTLLQQHGRAADDLSQEASRLGRLLERAQTAGSQTEVRKVLADYVSQEVPSYKSAESYLRHNPRLVQSVAGAGQQVAGTVGRDAQRVGWMAWLTYQASRGISGVARVTGAVVRGGVTVLTAVGRLFTFTNVASLAAGAVLGWVVNEAFDSSGTPPPQEARTGVQGPAVPGAPNDGQAGQPGGEPTGEGPAVAPPAPSPGEPGNQGGAPGDAGPADDPPVPAPVPAPAPPPAANPEQPSVQGDKSGQHDSGQLGGESGDSGQQGGESGDSGQLGGESGDSGQQGGESGHSGQQGSESGDSGQQGGESGHSGQQGSESGHSGQQSR